MKFFFLIWCSVLFQTSSSVSGCAACWKLTCMCRLFLDPNADYGSKKLAQISRLWPHWANNLCIWNTVVLFFQSCSGSSCLFHDLLAEEENNCLSQRKPKSPDRAEIRTYSDFMLFPDRLCLPHLSSFYKVTWQVRYIICTLKWCVGQETENMYLQHLGLISVASGRLILTNSSRFFCDLSQLKERSLKVNCKID